MTQAVEDRRRGARVPQEESREEHLAQRFVERLALHDQVLEELYLQIVPTKRRSWAVCDSGRVAQSRQPSSAIVAQGGGEHVGISVRTYALASDLEDVRWRHMHERRGEYFDAVGITGRDAEDQGRIRRSEDARGKGIGTRHGGGVGMPPQHVSHAVPGDVRRDRARSQRASQHAAYDCAEHAPYVRCQACVA